MHGFRRCLHLLLAISVSSCDHPSAPPPGPSKAGPPPGVLRLTPGPLPKELTDDPNFRVGLPSIAFQVEYRGPQPAIRHDAETFVKGESKGGMKGVRMMSLPCQIDMAFALGEDKDSKGVVIAAESEKQATRSGSGVLTTRHGGTSSQPQTVSTRGRQCRIYQPAWPLDIRDGEE